MIYYICVSLRIVSWILSFFVLIFKIVRSDDVVKVGGIWYNIYKLKIRRYLLWQYYRRKRTSLT